MTTVAGARARLSPLPFPLPLPLSLSLLVGLAAPAAGGCLTMQAPPRFLVVDRGCDTLRAITPEESKLWVREFDDGDRGGLPFWRDALLEDMKKNRGYVVVSEADTKDGAGTPGKELVLETTVSGRPVRELLALFVRGGLFSDTIRVVEYVAEKDQFDKEVAGVRASLATLQ